MQESTLALSVCLIGAGVAAVIAVWQLARGRRISDTPSQRIRSASQGHVELDGWVKAMPGPAIVAPMTRTPCVWWRFSITEKKGYGKNRRTVVVAKGASDDVFLLYDGTDECVVDPAGARVVASEKNVWHGNHRFPDRGPNNSGWSLGSRFTYREERIPALTGVHVGGYFRTQRDNPARSEREALTDLLRRWKQDMVDLLKRYDDDGDGNIDPEEWENARRDALEHVRQQQLDHGINPDLHVLTRPPRTGGRRAPFFISAVPQSKLVRGFYLRAAGAAGFAILLFGAAAHLMGWV